LTTGRETACSADAPKKEVKIHESGEKNMKKAVVVFAAVVVVAGLVSAPVAAATKINFGLKAGVSIADNKWSDDDGSEKALIRPTFGAFAPTEFSMKNRGFIFTVGLIF
jgi:hypothetical protein